MKKNNLLLFLFLFVLLGMNACGGSRNEKFIQGSWERSGNVMEKSGHDFHWFIRWTFKKGNYVQEGYPPLYTEGKYKVKKEEGDKITLSLYNSKGNFLDDRNVTFTLNRKDDLLTEEQGVPEGNQPMRRQPLGPPAP